MSTKSLLVELFVEELPPKSLKRLGEAFGTWALVDESQREHKAECVEAGTLLALGREDFDEFTVNAPTVLRGMMQVLARRLRGLAERLPDTARIEAEGTSADSTGDDGDASEDG